MKFVTLVIILVDLTVNVVGKETVRGARGSIIRHLQKNKDKDNGNGNGSGNGGLIEVHSCEPNPQRAIDFVNIMGHAEKGDQGCLADPVNSCGGGCCRFGAYFICDTDNFAPHLACVCNSNTAPLPVSSPAPAPSPLAPAPTSTATGSAAVPTDDIVDTAIAAGSFTTLVDLVALAGLVGALKSPQAVTVFAPLDSAFPPSGPMLEAFKNTTDVETLRSILLYHVVPGRIMAADLFNGARLTTLQGSNVTITLTNSSMIDQANIVQADIEASNGIIHGK